MSCIFWARGEDFAVDEFVAASPLIPSTVFRRGEPKLRTRPHDLCEFSGLTIQIGDRGFDDFDGQISSAVAFLKNNKVVLRHLGANSAVTSMGFDFGIRWKATYTHTDCLPGELIKLAGEFGLDIHLSHYPISNDVPPDGVR